MKRILKTTVIGLLMLTGCESMANLTPANDQAEQLSGEIPVHMTTVSTGNGSMEAIGPGNELLKGNYGPMQGDYNFGSIFNAVYGQYSTLPTAASRGTPTVATLAGTKGTTLKCEFYNNDYTNNGFGACKSLTGALYKLSY